jgi:regulator of protease activity HflC (stomatin/prohibitin superfamily)
MSMVVVVEPGEQAVRLRSGRVVGDVAQGALIVKWPWPIETVERHDIGQVRSLVLGAKLNKTSAVNLWPVEGEADAGRSPFIVLANPASVATSIGDDASDAQRVSNQFALVDADLVLEYRVKADGLLDYLSFASDSRSRTSPLDMRERVLRAMALREASQLFSTRSIDQVLSPAGDSLVRQLRDRIQSAFDASHAGVEVVGLLIPTLRPPAGESAGMFEELSIDVQNSRKVVDEARRIQNTTLSSLMGTPQAAIGVVEAIHAYRTLERELGANAPAVVAKRASIERALVDAGAQAASVVSAARARRWDMLMRARSSASDVAGQAPAYRACPELYRERAIMSVLNRSLAQARIKYVLAVDPDRVDFDVQMEQPEPGLNLGDYLEKKDGK